MNNSSKTLRSLALLLLVAMLGGDVAIAHADPPPDEHLAIADSTNLLSVAIAREGHRFAKNGYGRVRPAAGLPQGFRQARAERCTSKTKGALIGAAIGAAAFGSLAAYVDPFGPRSEAVAPYAALGAGVGAALGLAHCW